VLQDAAAQHCTLNCFTPPYYISTMSAYKGEGKLEISPPPLDFWKRIKSERNDIKKMHQILIT
jgi:hypothetical protein